LDLPSIERKIVAEGRGGWCFEQNILFMNVLRSLGFTVTGLAARVMWNQPEGVIRPRAHMLLLVNLNGSQFIADTGFGSLTLPQPLPFKTNERFKTTHEDFRIIPDADEFIIQAEIQGEWRSMYKFALQEYVVVDYEVANHFLCTHPDSHFLQNVIAARVAEGRRYTLRNRELNMYEGGTVVSRRELQNVDELLSVLTNVFRISIPSNNTFYEGLRPVFHPPAQ
jgi:N-hydroxyarylamine O-acetyltransferase